MEISPRQLVLACAAIFVGIVSINILAQARDSDEVKDRLSKLDLNSLVPRLKREEMMEQPEINEEALISRLNDEDGTPIFKED